MWVPPEARDLALLHHPTRKSVGYFGAVCLQDGRFIYRREEDRFNACSFWAFLQELRQRSRAAGKCVVVITDNARYHHARLHKDWRQEQQASFRLDFLPPYSPDLNPIERVWKLARRQCLHNRYFSTLREVITSVENKFAEWTVGNVTLHKLCAIN